MFGTTLKLALLSCNLHLCPTIAQAHFTALYAGHESYLLPALFVNITDTPDLCDERVTRFDGTREPCSKLFDVGWIRVPQKLQESMGCSVPTEQAVKNSTTYVMLVHVMISHHQCFRLAYQSPSAGQVLEWHAEGCNHHTICLQLVTRQPTSISFLPYRYRCADSALV